MPLDRPNLENISVKTTEGDIVSLSSMMTNKPTYLKFWASWCQPCQEQMPHLQETYKKYGEKLNVIAINLGVNDSTQQITKIREKFSLTLPTVIDETGKLAQTYNLIAAPYHVLLDEQHNVVHKGNDLSADLNNKLALLSENAPHNLPTLRSENVNSNTNNTNNNNRNENNNNIHPIINHTTGPNLLFFTSAWCDWYLEKSRPELSSNCIQAQHLVNQLYDDYSHLRWTGILSQLWTGENEQAKYRKKYGIKYATMIDTDNNICIEHQVNNFPTLIAINNDNVLFRIQNFNDTTSIIEKFEQFKTPNN